MNAGGEGRSRCCFGGSVFFFFSVLLAPSFLFSFFRSTAFVCSLAQRAYRHVRFISQRPSLAVAHRGSSHHNEIQDFFIDTHAQTVS
jgi:hypothetical protein